MELQELIEVYLDDCRDRDLAKRTVDWYGWHLRRCHQWMIEEQCTRFDEETLAAYVRSCRNLALSSRRHMIAAFKAFGKWMARHGLKNPTTTLVKPKKKKTLPRVLSPSEVERLLEVVVDEPIRERALIYMFLDSGLRVSEMAALQRGEVDLKSHQVTVRNGKGSKDRVVYISPTTASLLAEYLATHNFSYVWHGETFNGRAGQLTDCGIRLALGRLAKRHGFKALNPHLLRHTCGTELAAQGVNLEAIAEHLGHEDISTTTIYIKLAGERQRRVIQGASPVESNLGMRVTRWPTSQPTTSS